MYQMRNEEREIEGMKYHWSCEDGSEILQMGQVEESIDEEEEEAERTVWC